jgi:flagellar FliJ protein
LKSFAFKLEKILNLRLNRERETEIELGRTIGALTVLEIRIKNTAEEKVKAAKDRFAQNRSVNEMRSYEFYILRLDQTKETLLEAAAMAELEVEKARAVYIEASRERKILDKLKEKRQKEYYKAMLAEDEKILDDISGGTAARKALDPAV